MRLSKLCIILSFVIIAPHLSSNYATGLSVAFIVGAFVCREKEEIR